MIVGNVSGRHAFVPLEIQIPGGKHQIVFILDSGFTGFFTLPLAVVQTLGLPFSHPIADGGLVAIERI